MAILTAYRQKILFVIIFALLGLAALQVPFTQLAGSKVKFTLFDFFGPIATGFIGTLPGMAAVLLMQLGNFLVHGAQVADAGTIIRFFPTLAAAYYFGRKDKVGIVLPLLAIVTFVAHPIGRTVWYYSLFWTIPVFCYFLRDRSLFARALGAAFTAHAVGGALWIWAFNLPAAVWISLIPVVAMERLLFASGIAGVYVLLNNVLFVLSKKRFTPNAFLVNKKYVFLN